MRYLDRLVLACIRTSLQVSPSGLSPQNKTAGPFLAPAAEVGRLDLASQVKSTVCSCRSTSLGTDAIPGKCSSINGGTYGTR